MLTVSDDKYTPYIGGDISERDRKKEHKRENIIQRNNKETGEIC